MPLVPVFVTELQTFKLRAPVISGNDPKSWREGQNDDLVFSVALAGCAAYPGAAIGNGQVDPES